MKKKLLRAALVAGLSMFAATATFVAQPAYAADSKPQVSKSIRTQLSDAQKALQAKDWATAIAKCTEAKAATDLTDYDRFMINYFLGFAYFNSGDRAKAAEAYATAAVIPDMPADDHKSVLHNALLLEADQNNYAKVIEVGQVAAKENALDATTAGQVAIAYYNTNDLTNAETFAQKSIDLATAAGKLPERAAYEVIVFSQNKQKDIPGETKTFETMANYYGNADDWGHVIDLALISLSNTGKGFREVAALDLYRLRLLVGATTPAEDYTTMADAAQLLHSYGDVITALETGLSKGVLNQAKVAGMLKKAKADAAADQPILAQAEASAAKSATPDKDLSVAEAYYGYGRYADAARVAQRAAAKGGPKAAQAKLLLGMAQARQGDDATATTTLATVEGDPALAKVAHIWTLYTTRKYGKTPAAAPAAGAH